MQMAADNDSAYMHLCFRSNIRPRVISLGAFAALPGWNAMRSTFKPGSFIQLCGDRKEPYLEINKRLLASSHLDSETNF